MLLCLLRLRGQRTGDFAIRQRDTVTRNRLHFPDTVGHIAALRVTFAEAHSVPLRHGAGVFDGIKVGHGWVESPGRSVSETATVFASVTQRELDNATLNQLAQSGSHLRLYSAQDAARTTEKLSRHTAFSVVSEQLKSRSGETDLDAAIAQQKAGLHTPAEQAIHLAIPLLESQDLTFSRPQLLATAMETGGGKVSMADIDTTIQAQIRSGQLLNVPVAPGRGNDLLISRQAWDAEKSILTRVLEGKDAVAPLMDRVPDSLMTELTAGQRAATRMILESTDRFTVVQGYAGVGKTTQFRAVMSAISLLPEETRPRVIGLAPTHRAVGEMQSAGVDARTTASFLHDTQLLQRNGQTPDFSNTLFLLDESSMVGLADMAKAHSLIAAGGGRAVPSGDTDQLPPIASGQPFRLTQQRSAADVAIMKEIVRQVPELRPAVYSLIERDVHRALTTIEQVTPEQVPRKEGAWAPGSSVVEFTQKQEKEIEKALSEGKTLPEGQPATLYEALVKDYTGRTPEAQSQTLVITHLNKDRRALNSLIHDARRENGETGKEEITLPVLVTSNIRDGELRKLSTWTAHKEAVALVDNVYHRISKVDKDNQLITLTDSEGKERFISPREASAEGVTLYRQEKIPVLLDALQVANSLNVVGQHGTNGDGGFLNFLFNQIRCRRVLQIGAQLVDFNGQHGIDQLLVAAIVVFAHQIRAFGKDSATGALPERVFFGTHRDKGVGDVVEVRQRQALFPQIPGRAARVQRVEDFIQ